jgi:2-polyprenyl-3-methyl-5-hydroxy-6-metoxy-1,4-benzoquinol methylase
MATETNTQTSSTSGSPQFDKDRAKAFGAKMIGVLNGGAMSLMLSVGHKTGLLDSMDGEPPRTVEDIAQAAGMHPRPVREWLSGIACFGIIDYDAEAETFYLPPEHAGLLTRRAGPLNLATSCQYVALLGEVEDEVADSFADASGVAYDRYPKFQSLMAESSGQRYEMTIVDQIVPILPGGADAFERGIDVADVGCGSGRALGIFGKAFPNSRFVGFDISEQGIEAARRNSSDAGLDNVSYQQRDAAALDEHERFDLVVTFDAIHDQAHPDRVLSGVHAMLKPGGTYLCVEPKASSSLEDNLGDVMSPFLYTVSTMHCMQVSLAYGGEGLGAAWGHQTATERLTKAGFTDIELTGVHDDRTNNYFISHRP